MKNRSNRCDINRPRLRRDTNVLNVKCVSD